MIEYASRLADDKTKLSTRFNDLSQILAESGTWAKLSHLKVVTEDIINKAIDEKIQRVRKYDEKYSEMIRDNTLLISTSRL